MAYKVLTDEQYKLVWDKFEKNFTFNPSIHSKDWPSLITPTPSITYSFKDYMFNDDFDYYDEWLICGLRELCLNESLYALDWQHDSFEFTIEEYADLPIGLYPDGDYFIFLRKDFSSGVFTHPWEESVCIFGKELLNILKKYPAPFHKALR